MRIEDSIAVVTGANRGLGKAFVNSLLEAGAAKVYACARDPLQIAGGDRIVPIRLDITSAEQVNAAARGCSDADLLFNNAGILRDCSVLGDGAEDALRAELEVNVFGTLRMLRAFAPVLARRSRSAIANILSVTSLMTYPFNATYAASKHAALALTDGARVQLRAQNTLVLAVFAGYIDTDMAASVTGAKTPALQVAERTLTGIKNGSNQVFGDERAAAASEHVNGLETHLLTSLTSKWV
jgi:NAD(P)-dependent dehydrogenase (short-subunit alcohol dehydrogenase family)